MSRSNVGPHVRLTARIAVVLLLSLSVGIVGGHGRGRAHAATLKVQAAVCDASADRFAATGGARAARPRASRANGNADSMTSLRIAHMSGRYNAPVAHVAIYIDRLMNTRHLDALTTTESQEPDIGAVVHACLGHGFHVVKRHEYMVITRNSTLIPVAGSLAYRSLSTNITGPQAWRNMRTVSSSYRVAGSDKTVIFYATHAPATVDQSDPHYVPGNTGPQVASRIGFTAMGRWIASRAGRNVVQLSDMDSNVDWHDPMWRRTVLSETGGTSIWSASRPAAGTHQDNRLVDTAIVFNAHITSACISPANRYRPAALDHKTIEYTVAFPRR